MFIFSSSVARGMKGERGKGGGKRGGDRGKGGRQRGKRRGGGEWGSEGSGNKREC